MKKIFVTTSWDDGHLLDMRLATLLEKYGLTGTFYISRSFAPDEMMSEAQIKELSRRHEIGGHTMAHPDLTKIAPAAARKEILENKRWLEAVAQKPLEMFCYPFGAYSADVSRLAREAGFTGARTTRTFSNAPLADAYQMHPTVHAYPFPFRKRDATGYLWRHLLQPAARQLQDIIAFGIPVRAWTNFESLAIGAFNRVCETGGAFHLWGHSWEIEKYGMWETLERVCAAVAQQRDRYRAVTNGELLELISKTPPHGVAAGF